MDALGGERPVDTVAADQEGEQGGEQGRIRARARAQVVIGAVRGLGADGVDDDQAAVGVAGQVVEAPPRLGERV